MCNAVECTSLFKEERVSLFYCHNHLWRRLVQQHSRFGAAESRFAIMVHAPQERAAAFSRSAVLKNCAFCDIMSYVL